MSGTRCQHFISEKGKKIRCNKRLKYKEEIEEHGRVVEHYYSCPMCRTEIQNFKLHITKHHRKMLDNDRASFRQDESLDRLKRLQEAVVTRCKDVGKIKEAVSGSYQIMSLSASIPTNHNRRAKELQRFMKNQMNSRVAKEFEEKALHLAKFMVALPCFFLSTRNFCREKSLNLS